MHPNGKVYGYRKTVITAVLHEPNGVIKIEHHFGMCRVSDKINAIGNLMKLKDESVMMQFVEANPLAGKVSHWDK